MKILYDSQMFLKQKYGGITKYFCELMQNLSDKHSYNLALLFADNQHLKDFKALKKLNISLPKEEFRGKGRIKTSFYNINRLYSSYQISLNNFDLLHPTYYDTYFLKNVKKPFIVTVHDLIEFKFKEQYRSDSLIPNMKEIITKANRLIAISENTRNDLIEILNIKPEKIDVIYHGFTQHKISPLPSNPYGRYILFVGYRGGYKNFISLAEAFRNLTAKDKDLKLICAGQPFTKKELEDLKSLQILDKTIAVGANEKLLNELYSNALAFVYPTKYEGFGMSILEAFANNCPVCLSNTSSLPEVAGDAGAYFDPYSTDSIQEVIEKVIYDKEFSNKMIEKGKKRLHNFSWKKCADETAESYKKTIG
jgi:glycosyltransferase involved in cell wall biosynthesis